jgi:hypothetical protein
MRTVGLTIGKADGDSAPSLSGNKESLLAIAAAEGVEVDPEGTKAEIRAAIESARSIGKADGDSA